MNRLKLSFPYLVLAAVLAIVVGSNLPLGETGEEAIESSALVCSPCGMEVDPDSALSAEIDGSIRYYCGDFCREEDRDGGGPTEATAKASVPLVDVVCHMEVNSAWGFESTHGGTTYHFCAEQCKRLFDENPAHYLAEKCVVCAQPLGDGPVFTATYLGKAYQLCSEEHRAAFKRDPAGHFMHKMWGIPQWLYYGSIAIVLIISFGLFDWMGRRKPLAASPSRQTGETRLRIGREQIRGEGERLAEHLHSKGASGSAMSIALPVVSAPFAAIPRQRQERAVAAQASRLHGDRFDLLSIRWIAGALRSRVFRFCLQLFFVIAFLLVVAAGMFGNQNPALNIAPILTWTIWWALLIVLIMFAGKAWCYVCPWDAIAGWTEKLALWRKSDDGLSMGRRWPRIVRNISIATILFIGLTWIELGFGVTMKPRITAYLAIAMLLMAVVSALLFDRKSFCRYGCLVGRVSGLYALFAGTEVRARSSSVCQACHTKECIKGSETAYGCPTFLYPGKLKTNTYCIQCMECIQACPHDNLAVNLRPWASDLAAEGKPRADEAYLALLMLSITGFHGLTMTPVWGAFTDMIRGAVDAGRVLAFSIGMAVLMLGPILVYAALVWASKRLADAGRSDGAVGDGGGARSYRDYFIRYAYALLPIALFYHIAHNLEHLLMEGPKVIARLSDPFGWNWNLFGTAGWTIPPLVSLDKLWLIQVFLVLVGHVYSLWVAQKTSLRLFGSARAAFRSQLPMLVGMICFSVFSLWLLKQPMEMRTSAM